MNPTVIESRPVHSIDSGGFERAQPPAAAVERDVLADVGCKLKEPLKSRSRSDAKAPPMRYARDEEGGGGGIVGAASQFGGVAV